MARSTWLGARRRSTEKGARNFVPVVGNGLQLARRLGERDVDDLVAVERGHAAELAVLDEVGGLQAEARREDAVAGRGGAAALDVPEDGDARLEPCPLLELAPDCLADAAVREQLVPELVDLALVL